MSNKIFTVSEISGKIKSLLESNFPRLGVAGEISNLRKASSGHVYFTLKDEGSRLGAVLFRSAARRLRFEPEDGLLVTARGRIDVYRPRGSYQLIVSRLEPRGAGALQLAFERLKRKLDEEGLFDRELKKPIPRIPERIGVVTSPTGAALRDILQVVERRFAGLNVIINPVRVQGEEAAGEISRAVDEFNRLDNVDVIIVSRGGGSLEDLWAFNEEKVVRSVSRSRIPVISAVGHEIDITLSDLAADLRAPTPSAAAELVIAEKEEISRGVRQLQNRLDLAVGDFVKSGRFRLDSIVRILALKDPRRLIPEARLRLDELLARMDRRLDHRFRFFRQESESLENRLGALNPASILKRGYSFTRSLPDGNIIKDVAKLKKGTLIETTLFKGSFEAEVHRTRDRKTLPGKNYENGI